MHYLTVTLALVALVLGACAALAQTAPSLPPLATIRTDIAYPTLEMAVRNQLRAAMSTSANLQIEIGGVIYERNGRYYPSTWLYGEAHSIPQFHFGLYRGATVVAMWHTHPDPNPARSDGFSATDVRSAHIAGLDAYVGVITTDTIRRLRLADIRRGQHDTFHATMGEVTDL